MAYDSHLIIPFASSLEESCRASMKQLALPNLTRFLKNANLQSINSGDEFDFIVPHERVLGLTKQVVVTPCHWSVGIDNIRMENPDDLRLSNSESRALFDTVSAYFQEDGIMLTYQSASVWHASSPLLNDLPLASLDRVIGRNVDVWQPPTQQSKKVRRLQNEVQMLLYTHPVNETRATRGLASINSFWLSRAAHVNPCADFSLRDSSLRGDWQSWSLCWLQLDQKVAAASQITLCGERHAVTYAIPEQQGFFARVKRLISPQANIHQILQDL